MRVVALATGRRGIVICIIAVVNHVSSSRLDVLGVGEEAAPFATHGITSYKTVMRLYQQHNIENIRITKDRGMYQSPLEAAYSEMIRVPKSAMEWGH